MAVVPALAMLGGSVVGMVAAAPPSPAALVALVVASSLAGWGLGARHPGTVAAAVALGFFAGGVLLTAAAWQAAWRPSLRAAFDEAASDGTVRAVVTGVLRADATPRPSGVSLSLAVTGIQIERPDTSEAYQAAQPGCAACVPTPAVARAVEPGEDGPLLGGLLLTVGGTLARDQVDAWRAGRTIRAPALLRRPSRYLNPGVPDEERRLARRGTVLVGSVKSGALVSVIAPARWPAERIGSVRAHARRALAASVGRWSPRSAGIVAAIVIGDRAGLDDEVERRLQEAGTYHVIAISGGNIAILAGLVLGLFRLAGRVGRTAMVTAVAVLVAYAVLVGGGASVNRATVMAGVYLAARAVDLRGAPTNVLAVAAALLVAADPLSIADPGFLLTFGATTAIVLAVPALVPRSVPRLLFPVAATLAASVAVEAVLFPVTASVFSRVTLAGLVLNVLAIPLMTCAQVAGMTAAIAYSVAPALGTAAGWCAHLGAEGLVRSADLVRLVPALTWRVSPPAWPGVILYYGALVTAWTLWRHRRATGSAERSSTGAVRRWAGALAIVAALWILAAPWALSAARPGGRLRVTFLDVGQGDSSLVQFPTGHTLLVDAGGLPAGSAFDLGDRVVAPVLRRAGIRRLDVMALTHGDADHIGGLLSIAREFRPGDVWEGVPVPRLDLLEAIRSAATAAGARWTTVQAGDRMAFGPVEVRVHHPELPEWERQTVRNDDSLVLEVLWDDVSIVLAGDIGRDVEASIADRLPAVRTRVLKVPHHGSATSSSPGFIRALSPSAAVISAGRANLFGHPVAAVVDCYREAGVELFRTDEDGAVELETDGSSVSVTTFSGRRWTARSHS